MALKNILARVLADVGGDISQQRDYWLDLVNRSAQDLYRSFDLPGCLREQIFEMGATDQQVALPYYVDEIRAVRDYEAKLPLTLRDLAPRYQSDGWKTLWDWRIKHQNYPFKSSWLSDGKLKFTLKSPAARSFTIAVVGATYTASKVEELVTVQIGAEEVETANVYNACEVESIRKSVVTAEDILVYAMDDTIISEIPNSELQPSYTIIQILDGDCQRSQSWLVEILYKTRFTPFSNDNDEFLRGDIFDEAIYWNTLAFTWAKNGGDQWTNKVIAASAKARDIINQIILSKGATKNHRIDFGSNQYQRVMREGLYPLWPAI